MPRALSYLAILVSLIGISLAESQSLSADFLQWGIGIIQDTKEEHSETLDFPRDTVAMYDSSGKKVGFLYEDPAGKSDPNLYWWLRGRLFADSNSFAVQGEDVREVTYEGTCLKYYERKQQYVRVLAYTFKNQPLWLNIEELQHQGYEIEDWKSFISRSPQDREWFRMQDEPSSLLLRDVPSTKGRVLFAMKGFNHIILSLGEWKGSWLRVHVLQYSVADCAPDPSNLIKEYRGWIRALDPKGFPRIWFPTRGC